MTIRSNINKVLLTTSLATLPFITYAQTTTDTTSTYLYNLGLYMGVNIAGAPATQGTTATSTVTPDVDVTTNSQFSAVAGAAASLPFMVQPDNYVTYIPSSLSNYEVPYDTLTNAPSTSYSVWKDFSKADPDEAVTSLTTITAIPGVDQSSTNGYYGDLVSQSIFDLMTTPDYTYCAQNNSASEGLFSSLDAQCLSLSKLNPIPLTSFEVENNVLDGGSTILDKNSSTQYITLGTNLPDHQYYFSAEYNQKIVPQLTSTSLTGPLMYNTSPNLASDGSTPYLPVSQASQAQAFIKNLSGANLPILPSYNDFEGTFKSIRDTNASDADRNAALKAYYKYFLSLRSFASGMSVGLSNLSSIMASRMPNTLTNTSQAFDEYNMATRRVFSPKDTIANYSADSGATNEWITEMEKASPVTMQREMLYLLAEINYQLYLARKQDEKILLTLSAMELQYTNSARSMLRIVPDSVEE